MKGYGDKKRWLGKSERSWKGEGFNKGEKGGGLGWGKKISSNGKGKSENEDWKIKDKGDGVGEGKEDFKMSGNVEKGKWIYKKVRKGRNGDRLGKGKICVIKKERRNEDDRE